MLWPQSAASCAFLAPPPWATRRYHARPGESEEPCVLDGLTSTHNRSNRDTMLAGLCCDPTSRCSKQRSPKMHHYLHNRGATMRTMIDVVCHALEVRWQLASAPVRWLRAARWPNIATALIVAFMAAPLVPEPASAGDNEIRIGNTMPYSGPA